MLSGGLRWLVVGLFCLCLPQELLAKGLPYFESKPKDLIIPGGCIERAANIGVFESVEPEESTPSRMRELLSKSYDGPFQGDFDFATIHRAYEGTLSELNRDLRRHNGRYIPYLISCSNQQQECYSGHFKPSGMDLQLYCDEQIFQGLIEYSLKENYDKLQNQTNVGIPRLQNLERMRESQVQEALAAFSEKLGAEVLAKSEVQTTIVAIEALFDLWQKKFETKIKLMDASTTADGFSFILRKIQEELGSWNNRIEMQREVRRYFAQFEMVRVFEQQAFRKFHFGEGLLDDYQTLVHTFNYAFGGTQNVQVTNAAPFLMYSSTSETSAVLLEHAEGQCWKDQLSGAVDLCWSHLPSNSVEVMKDDYQLQYYQFRERNPAYQMNDSTNRFDEMVLWITSDQQAVNFDLMFSGIGEDEVNLLNRESTITSYERKEIDALMWRRRESLREDIQLYQRGYREEMYRGVILEAFHQAAATFIVRWLRHFDESFVVDRFFPDHDQAPRALQEGKPKYKTSEMGRSRFLEFSERLICGEIILDNSNQQDLIHDQWEQYKAGDLQNSYCSGRMNDEKSDFETRSERFLRLYEAIGSREIIIEHGSEEQPQEARRRYIYGPVFVAQLNDDIYEANRYCFGQFQQIQKGRMAFPTGEKWEKRVRYIEVVHLQGLRDLVGPDLMNQSRFLELIDFQNPETLYQRCFSEGYLFGEGPRHDVGGYRPPRKAGIMTRLGYEAWEFVSGFFSTESNSDEDPEQLGILPVDVEDDQVKTIFRITLDEMHQVENIMDIELIREFQELAEASSGSWKSAEEKESFLKDCMLYRTQAVINYAVVHPSQHVGWLLAEYISEASEDEKRTEAAVRFSRGVAITAAVVGVALLAPHFFMTLSVAATTAIYTAEVVVAVYAAHQVFYVESPRLSGRLHRRSLMDRGSMTGNFERFNADGSQQIWWVAESQLYNENEIDLLVQNVRFESLTSVLILIPGYAVGKYVWRTVASWRSMERLKRIALLERGFRNHGFRLSGRFRRYFLSDAVNDSQAQEFLKIFTDGPADMRRLGQTNLSAADVVFAMRNLNWVEEGKTVTQIVADLKRGVTYKIADILDDEVELMLNRVYFNNTSGGSQLTRAALKERIRYAMAGTEVRPGWVKRLVNYLRGQSSDTVIKGNLMSLEQWRTFLQKLGTTIDSGIWHRPKGSGSIAIWNRVGAKALLDVIKYVNIGTGKKAVARAAVVLDHVDDFFEMFLVSRYQDDYQFYREIQRLTDKSVMGPYVLNQGEARSVVLRYAQNTVDDGYKSAGGAQVRVVDKYDALAGSPELRELVRTKATALDTRYPRSRWRMINPRRDWSKGRFSKERFMGEAWNEERLARDYYYKRVYEPSMRGIQGRVRQRISDDLEGVHTPKQHAIDEAAKSFTKAYEKSVIRKTLRDECLKPGMEVTKDVFYLYRQMGIIATATYAATDYVSDQMDRPGPRDEWYVAGGIVDVATSVVLVSIGGRTLRDQVGLWAPASYGLGATAKNLVLWGFGTNVIDRAREKHQENFIDLILGSGRLDETIRTYFKYNPELVARSEQAIEEIEYFFLELDQKNELGELDRQTAYEMAVKWGFIELVFPGQGMAMLPQLPDREKYEGFFDQLRAADIVHTDPFSREMDWSEDFAWEESFVQMMAEIAYQERNMYQGISQINPDLASRWNNDHGDGMEVDVAKYVLFSVGSDLLRRMVVLPTLCQNRNWPPSTAAVYAAASGVFLKLIVDIVPDALASSFEKTTGPQVQE